MDKLSIRSAFPKGLKEFDLDEKRFLKASELTEERTAERGEIKWIYRDSVSGKIVEPGTLGALRYRRFWMYPSTEAVDFFDTVVERQAVINAMDSYIESGGGVRFMHEPKPIGRVFEGDYEIREKGAYVGLSIPEYEEDVFRKIEYKILTGASLGWNTRPGGIKWPENENDKIRFTDINIAEITLCDTRATPGTEIQEERSVESEGLLKKIYRMLKSLTSRSGTGGTPDNPILEDDDMTPEQLKELTDAIQTSITGGFEQLKRTAEPDPQEPDKTLEERIAAAITAKTEEQINVIKNLQDEITALKRATNTEEPLSGVLDTIEKKVVAMEELAEKAEKPELSDNDRLSFIQTRDGRPLTIDILKVGV